MEAAEAAPGTNTQNSTFIPVFHIGFVMVAAAVRERAQQARVAAVLQP
jgi:hypothetical protein